MGVIVTMLGLAVTSAASLHCLWLIPREEVPENPWLHRLGLALGALIAVAGAFLGPWLLTLAPALLTVAIAALHLNTLADARLPAVSSSIEVGRPFPSVAFQDETGTVVDSASWRGQRILLKVFRGHWCPYCSAELRRLDALRSRLEASGVSVVGLSQDTPDLVVYMRARDGIKLALFADPELHAIKALGLVQDGGQVFKTIRVLGIPIGVPIGRRELPVPTNVLVDEHGIVRWLDIATDYRLRADNARILAAVRAAFGET
jgi:peroxiredoxin